MKFALSDLHLHHEEAAFAHVEARLWPDGPVCRHCGGTERIGKLKGKTTRPGLYKCYACKKPFTVRMGTIFESSHVPLHIWLQVIYLIELVQEGIRHPANSAIPSVQHENRVVPRPSHPRVHESARLEIL